MPLNNCSPYLLTLRSIWGQTEITWGYMTAKEPVLKTFARKLQSRCVIACSQSTSFSPFCFTFLSFLHVQKMCMKKSGNIHVQCCGVLGLETKQIIFNDYYYCCTQPKLNYEENRLCPPKKHWQLLKKIFCLWVVIRTEKRRCVHTKNVTELNEILVALFFSAVVGNYSGLMDID